MAVAAVIVTFNSASVIDQCLEAVFKMMPEALAVVVDNDSSDGTVDQVRALMQTQPRVRLIENRENRGFAAAVNQGVREAGDVGFVWLLNPDTCVRTALDDLVKASDRYGLAAGKLVDGAGIAQAGFTVRRLPTPASLVFELFGINRLWPSNPVNRKYRTLDRDLNQPGPVEQPAGACLMVRRDVWEKLGGLDERFLPVWFEDVDFCRRALDAGYRIEYVPSVVAVHEGAHSVGRIPPGRRAIYWCVSLLRYSEKHFRSFAFRGICMAVVLGSVSRMVVGMIIGRSFLPFFAYFKIMRFAGACMVSPAHVRTDITETP